ncbi:hypothetical protein KAI87_02210 [Myxococcota bacterium]|nr:hypothetical protein [Myxococcota bacterium]
MPNIVNNSAQNPGVQAPALNVDRLTSSAAGLETGDPRKTVAMGIRSGEVATKGSTEREFLSLMQESNSGFSLRDLPFDVATAILASRAEAMKDFFASWSESIEENAKLDKEAAKKSMELKRQTGMSPDQLSKSKLMLASGLHKAVNQGILDKGTAEVMANSAGISFNVSGDPVGKEASEEMARGFKKEETAVGPPPAKPGPHTGFKLGGNRGLR